MKRNLTWLAIVLLSAAYLVLSQFPTTQRKVLSYILYIHY
jgi:hypothetical protein